MARAPIFRIPAPVPAVLATLVLAVTAPAQGEEETQEPEAQDPQDLVDVDEQGRITMRVDENEGLPITDFIKLASQLTGREFTFSPTELQGNQNAKIFWIGPKTMERQEFFSFFQIMLYVNNFAVIRRGEGNTEVWEIVSLTGGKQREVSSSAIFVTPEEVREYASQAGVTILTTVSLDHINGQVAVNTLRPFFAAAGGAGAGGLSIGNVNQNTIVLQGFGPQVNAAYQMLELVDRPTEGPEIRVEVWPLEYIAAEEILQPLDEILNQRRPAAQGQQGQTPGQEIELKLVQLPGQNSILFSGTPEQIMQATDIIARVDRPHETTTSDMHVVPLKNVLAEDLSTTLREFLNQDLQAEQRAQQQAQPGGAGAGRQQRRVVIMDHAETNSLLVSGTSSKYQRVLQLIEELDRRQRQVLIEAAVVELSTSDLKRFGVELGLIDIADNGDFTRPFGFTSFGQSTFFDTDDDSIPDTRLPDFENPLQGVTGGIISGGDFAIPVLVNALGQDDRANILSLPSVLVNNNGEAIVETTESRPTQTTNQNASQATTSVGSPRQAGITLNISPTISSNNYLRLNIGLVVSRFVGAFDPNNPTGGGLIVSRTVNTEVTMPSNDTMVLGGVIEDQESESDSGVPFLKDIPLLGWLFKSGSIEKRKTNLYFFVTPHILDETDFSDLWEISNRRKMDAERYIGTRRMQLVDRRWQGGTLAPTLEDAESTPDDLDAKGNNAMPFYMRRNFGREPEVEKRLTPAPDRPGRDTGDGQDRGP